MKTNYLQNLAAAMAVTSLTLSGANALAEDSPTATTTQSAPINTAVPQLTYSLSQILQLTQAKFGDNTIIAYIKNSGNSYGLTADQIIYLHQQGVSDAVLNAMLNQPKTGVAAVMQTTSATPAASTASAKPITWGATEPVKGATLLRNPNTSSETNAPQPAYYYPTYYYPAYAWYPPVAFSFGWGWHGGWHGGWHR